MKIYIKEAIGFLIVIMLLQGCGTTTRLKRAGNEEIRTLWVKKYDIVDCGEGKIEGRAGIRFIKDSVLLLSLRNRSGLEGARVYVYRDSVFVFNRIKKTYYEGVIPGIIKKEINKGKEEKNQGLMRAEKQKKYFEYDLGDGNRVSLYVQKYQEIGKKRYIPGDVTIKLLYRNRTYCYRLKEPEYVVNGKTVVNRLNPGRKYKKVNDLDEAL